MSLKSENSKKPILLLVDGHSLAFRSFYAFSKGIDGGLTTKEGFPTSVTYGFLKSLLDNCKNISPEGVCITFDTEKPTFRHELDPNYKANRDVAPDVFFQDIEQLEIILGESLNLPIFKSPGYEADDILGTIANDASSKGWCVNILSGDRDLFQLVDDQKDIYVLYMGGGPYAKSGNPTLMNENGVKEKLGVAPERVVDLKALTGDSSDNIPGIKGVGPKTAINLLKENDTLDGIYKALDKIQQNNDKKYKGFIKGSVIEKLRNDKHNAFLSRDLAKINTEVPLILSDGYELKNINQELLSESLQKLELSTLLRQIDIFNSTFSKGGFDKNKVAKKEVKDPDASSKSELENSENEIPLIKVTVVNDFELIDKLIQRLEKTNEIVSLDTETNSLNPIDAELVGIGLCLGEETDDLFYIPLGHQTNKETPKQLSIEDVFSKLRTWIEDPKKEKALQNSKFDRQIFFNHGLDLKGVTFDTLLADYLLNNQEKHGLSEISFRLFGFKPPSFKETVGKNKDFSFVDIDEASIYCGYDVFLTFKVVKIFKERFSTEKNELIKLFEEIELPLEPVLSQMEMNGITIDIPYLEELSKELKSTLEDIESKVYELAEETFNLSSPKQLGEILFEKLNLDKKKSRKTKTGWSTDAVVLERLVDEHEIIQHLIKHRTLSKLLSTYIDALPNLINEKTGRVHTNFNQAATATGRLSSSNPNLQNIPVRTEFSRRIRKAFLPEKNWKLLSADYSQIELRILAHLADEEILINAFHKNDDIHSLTARLIFEKEEISSDERRVGKTINFGVIYGMGIKKFARSTGVSTPEAKEFLIKYKERYSKIFKFLELQERLALSKGYVKTIFGRKREFKFDKNGLGRLIGKDPYEIDLQSARRAGMEAQSLRAAANAPIQGSSADIIKIAMVQLNKKFIEMNVPAKMLLQVHDELLFEVEPDSLEITTKLVKKTMEDCVKLNVPLLVDIGIGDNWMETK
ncbi:DNA polymerase I [Prochlorococcus marinus XMU1419]|uniref:DNA polymerase I n=1 Tax=Prochlorococcus marinus TaxID=1219 RepID=UPI001ADC5D0E|nr:DNA polymerase I [Prochlorococcus marinus]MBO8234162.1 DNA polymerase I [Prochlorococcus marinus XMU1419]MBW3075851.1 DNA polymerase I [Prochlorococcus marinus str. XMU1419]